MELTTTILTLKVLTFLCQHCKQNDAASFIVIHLINDLVNITIKQGINIDPAGSLHYQIQQ